MEISSLREIALFEHMFWLQILGDHSRFIFNALSTKETDFIQQSNKFINLFDNLLNKSRRPISNEGLHELNYEAYSAAMKIREFKLTIIFKQLEEKISVNISPTFLNHMLNELDEYICILSNLIKGEMPYTRDINLHLLWLSDGEIHGLAVAGALDMADKELINRAREYSKVFENLYLKAIEYKGYIRTGIFDFPALRKLNGDVDDRMNCFKNFLKELEEGILVGEILGTLSPLMANHMFREECYYLTKLSMVSDTKAPGCNPTEPRIEI